MGKLDVSVINPGKNLTVNDLTSNRNASIISMREDGAAIIEEDFVIGNGSISIELAKGDGDESIENNIDAAALITRNKTNKIESFPVSAIFSGTPMSLNAATANIFVDNRHEYVLKNVGKKYQKFGPLNREACILQHLAAFKWAPQLVWHNSTSIVTSYVGESLNVFNFPLDYREQFEKILADMESAGIGHGDIYKPCPLLNGEDDLQKCARMNKGPGLPMEKYELMVQEVGGGKNPRLSLVDFGWAKFHGSYMCDNHTDKAPRSYTFHEDAAVSIKLELTFHRHLLVEHHFMVDWTLFYTEQHINEVIKSWPNLVIRKMVKHPMYPSNAERISVFSKFYNMKVDDFRGKTDFNMYFVYDMDPKYDLRPSSKGNRLVNVAMFDFKRALRGGMKGGFKIHATDNIQETKDNMVALGLQKEYQHRHFDTLRRVFDILNFSGASYVVLRNFENMPDEVEVDPNHLDVDLLVSDYYAVKRILDGDSPNKYWAAQYENGEYRVVNTVSIGGKRVNFDVRYVGDNYLDEKWQRDILQRRVKSHSVIYVPSDEDHLYSIIYHAIIQKPKISDTYVKVMTTLGNYSHKQACDKIFLRGELNAFMEKHGYNMVKPHDKTVGFYIK